MVGGLCSQRGLLAESEEQLFIVALTAKFREEYNRILAPINAQVIYIVYCSNYSNVKYRGHQF